MYNVHVYHCISNGVIDNTCHHMIAWCDAVKLIPQYDYIMWFQVHFNGHFLGISCQVTARVRL